MSQARIALIEKAFKKMDKSGDGKITEEDMAGVYDVTFHPKYKSGEWTRKQVGLQFFHFIKSKINIADRVYTNSSLATLEA